MTQQISAAEGIHVKPTPPELFFHHDVCAETRWENLYGRGYLTPASLFYIRNHGPTPIIDARTWQLSVEGPGVEKPLSLSYDELLRLPSVTVTRFIECAGNGRIFFQEYQGKVAKGRPWRYGSYAVAEWTGVALHEILERAHIKPSAVDVMPTGLDAAAVERPMPVSKAMQPDTIVAYAMNGDLLPPDHGFPARVVVPGWVGINSIKWVGKIFVSEEPVSCHAEHRGVRVGGAGLRPRPARSRPRSHDDPGSLRHRPGVARSRSGRPSSRPRVLLVRLRVHQPGRIQPGRRKDLGLRHYPGAQYPHGRLPVGVHVGRQTGTAHHHHTGYGQRRARPADARRHEVERTRLRVLGGRAPSRHGGLISERVWRSRAA